MGSLVSSVQNAYTTWKSGKDISTMTEGEMSQYNTIDAKFNANILKAQEIENTFESAFQESLANLDNEYRANRSALEVLWAAKRDNGYDTTYEV